MSSSEDSDNDLISGRMNQHTVHQVPRTNGNSGHSIFNNHFTEDDNYIRNSDGDNESNMAIGEHSRDSEETNNPQSNFDALERMISEIHTGFTATATQLADSAIADAELRDQVAGQAKEIAEFHKIVNELKTLLNEKDKQSEELLNRIGTMQQDIEILKQQKFTARKSNKEHSSFDENDHESKFGWHGNSIERGLDTSTSSCSDVELRGNRKHSQYAQRKNKTKSSSNEIPQRRLAPHEKLYQEKHREIAFKELLTSERTYTSTLWTLIDVVAETFKRAGFLSVEDLCTIFPRALPRLYNIHATLLGQLEFSQSPTTSTWNSPRHLNSDSGNDMGRLPSSSSLSRSSTPSFLKSAETVIEPLDAAGILLATFNQNGKEFFRLYREYFNDVTIAIKTINRFFNQSSRFRRLVEKLDSHPSCCGMDLQDFLLSPSQHLRIYLTLIQTISDNTPTDHPEQMTMKVVLRRLEGLSEEIQMTSSNHFQSAERNNLLTRPHSVAGYMTIDPLHPQPISRATLSYGDNGHHFSSQQSREKVHGQRTQPQNPSIPSQRTQPHNPSIPAQRTQPQNPSIQAQHQHQTESMDLNPRDLLMNIKRRQQEAQQNHQKDHPKEPSAAATVVIRRPNSAHAIRDFNLLNQRPKSVPPPPSSDLHVIVTDLDQENSTQIISSPLSAHDTFSVPPPPRNPPASLPINGDMPQQINTPQHTNSLSRRIATQKRRVVMREVGGSGFPPGQGKVRPRSCHLEDFSLTQASNQQLHAVEVYTDENGDTCTHV